MTDRALPAITPSVLAMLLSSGVFLTLAARSRSVAGTSEAWLGAWGIAAVVALLSSFRHALPALPGKVGGFTWLLAAATGAALVGRHAVDSLLGAWTDFPADESTLPGLDFGDSVLLVALVVPTLVTGLASKLRAPRPSLLLPGLFGLGVLLVLLVPFLTPFGPALRGEVPSPGVGSTSSFLVAAALLWVTTLPGPAALPLSSRRPLAHHWTPRLLGAATLVAIPALLLTLGGASGVKRAAQVQLTSPGARLFGRYGAEVGAGMECAVSLLAAYVLIVLCARVAARSLPGLRSGIFVVVAIAASLIAAWMPIQMLVVVTGVSGWLAVFWGTEPEGAAPPPLVDA